MAVGMLAAWQTTMSNQQPACIPEVLVKPWDMAVTPVVTHSMHVARSQKRTAAFAETFTSQKQKHSVDVPFNNLVKFMQKCSEVRNKDKEKQFQHFLEKNVPRKSQDVFQIFRLLLPAEDLDRRSYGAKEDRLAKLLVSAAGLSADSADAKHALNWKKSGRHAGQFPEMMEQYVLRNACRADGADVVKTITVARINESLDKLALAANDNQQQVKVLGDLMSHCSSLQMKWITRIIVKDLKIGMSKERMLRIFHPDAMELLNITSDLKRVCLELADPAARMARKDVEPGCCVKAQLCGRANSVEDCYAKMKGQPFTVEVKFDGNRLQIHRSEDSVYYFSRRGREHGGMSDYDVFDQVVVQQVLSPKVILDGEIVVWNKTRGVFEAFGGLRSTMIAAKEGVAKDEIVRMTDRGQDYNADPNYVHPTAGDIELVYIAFDLLFMGEESIITRPLHERQQLLSQAIKCIPADQPGIPCGAGTISGRVVALIPDQPVPLPLPGVFTPAAAGGNNLETVVPGSMPASSCAAPSELVFSRVGRSLADVQAMYDMALSRQEEGIVVKQLNSAWKPDDRSNNWLKMKPDYVTNAEIDAVIIGVYMGQSRRAGQVSEFLLGLTEGGGAGWGTEAVKWCSFCKVGTGMSDSERQQVHDRLLPVLIPAGPGSKSPRCYRVSGREKPDFWVSDPQRSVVVEVKSDIRTITSKMYAADYSLRFPRVTKLCWDRSALDITSYAQLERDVAENKGMITSMRLNMQLGVGAGNKRGKRATPRKTAASARKGARQLVVAAAQLPDVSGVSQVDDLLLGRKVAFLNYCSPSASTAEKAAAKQMFAELVAKHGGVQQVMKGPETDYVFAAHLSASDVLALSRKEATHPRAVHDVISTEWLVEVDQAGELLPIMPRHRLYMTYQGRLELAGRGDEFGDHDIFSNTFLQEVDTADVEALVTRLIPDSELARFQQQLAAGEQQLQQQLEAADTLAVAADSDEQPGGSTAADAPRTAQSVMLELQHELQMQTGWRNNRATLFAGCCLLFLPYEAGGSSSRKMDRDPATVADGEPGTDSTDLVLLLGVQAAQTAAAALAAAVAKQQLADIKLAVLLHGGSVVETYSSKVTHIVLWPVGPQQQQRQQQWLLQQQHQQDQGAEDPEHQRHDSDVRPHTWPWCEILLTGQGLQTTAQQLVSHLAAAATAAADAAAAAAAADAARASRGSSKVLLHGHQQHRRAKVQPPPPTAVTASTAGLDRLESATGAASGAAGGIKAVAARLAAGRSHVMDQVLREQQQQQVLPTPEPQLSPGALKHLRLLRRRLLAAQITDDNTPTGTSDSRPRKKRRTLALPDLYIVNPCWVTDSLAQVNSVSHTENTNTLAYGLIQRCSEILYAPVVHQQEQQQAQQDEHDHQHPITGQPAESAAAVNGSAADVASWPWRQFGLGPPGGSSSDSSDGDGSGSDSAQPKKKRQRRADSSSKAAAAGQLKKQARKPRQQKQETTATGNDAEEGGKAGDALAAPKKARTGKRQHAAAAAAAAVWEGDSVGGGVQSDQQPTQRQQQHVRGGKGRGRGRGRGKRGVESESSDDKDDYKSEGESAEPSDTGMSHSHGGHGSGSSEDHGVVDTAVGGSPAAADSAAQPQHHDGREGPVEKSTRSQQGRAAKTAAAAVLQPPGWLFSQEDEEEPQNDAEQERQQSLVCQEAAKAGDDDAAAAAAETVSQPATQRLPTRMNITRSAAPPRQQQQQQQEEDELVIADTPDISQPVLLSQGSLRHSGSEILQQQQLSGMQAPSTARAPAGNTAVPAALPPPPPAAAAASTRMRGLLGRIFDDDDDDLQFLLPATTTAAQPETQIHTPARAEEPSAPGVLSAPSLPAVSQRPGVSGLAASDLGCHSIAAIAAGVGGRNAGEAQGLTAVGSAQRPHHHTLRQKLGWLDEDDHHEGAILAGATDDIAKVAQAAQPVVGPAGHTQTAVNTPRAAAQAATGGDAVADVPGAGGPQQHQPQQQLASGPGAPAEGRTGSQQQQQQQLQGQGGVGTKPKRSLLKLKAQLDRRQAEKSDG